MTEHDNMATHAARWDNCAVCMARTSFQGTPSATLREKLGVCSNCYLEMSDDPVHTPGFRRCPWSGKLIRIKGSK